MERDILSCGEKELQELKKIILERNRYKALLNTLKEELNHQQDKLVLWKQEVEKEVLAEAAKQRNDSIRPLLDEIVLREMDVERVKKERDQKRRELIDALIREENQRYQKERISLEEDIEKTRQEEKVPSICLTKVFLALFYPQTGKEVLFLIAVIALLLVALPLGVYYIIYGGGNRSVLSTIYLIDVMFFYTAYLLINNFVKDKHLLGLKKILLLLSEKERLELRKNQVIKEIESLPDSKLELSEYTQELGRLEGVIGELKNKRDLALLNFDSDEQLKDQISGAIWESHAAEQKQLEDAINEAKATYDKCKNEFEKFKQDKNLEERYDVLLRIERNIFDIEVIDELIYIIRNGDADTIRSAIFKRQKKLGLM